MVGEDLGDKVGPLPVWGWGAALGAVAVGYMYYSRNKSTAAAPSTTVDPNAVGSTDPNATTADGVMSANDASLFTGSDQGNVSTPSPIVIPATPTPTPAGTPAPAPVPLSPTAWLAKCVAWESGRGRSPLSVQNALANYLAHRPMDATQDAIVNECVAHFGLPPGTNPTQHIPTTVPAPAPHSGAHSTAKTKEYTVEQHDNITKIVREFWGSASPLHVAAFRRMNGLGSNAHLHPGQHVMVKG